MDNFRSYEEGAGYYSQNFMSHEERHYLPDVSLEYLLELALFFSNQHLCTSISTTDSFLQDEFDAPFQGDIWVAMEPGAPHKGEKELKQELGGDAAEKKRQESEKTLSSPTQHLSASTTSAQSCLSQASEGDNHKGEKNLSQELGRGARDKKRNVLEEKPSLTFELVSRYYCMPIKQAAEVLDVGLTHLKRRCRELGIPRWPHRQVKSLERLIKNVQELGSDTEKQGEKTEILERLQRAKKLIEECPAGVELDHGTKVLRQAYFKENYKRRRLMAIEG